MDDQVRLLFHELVDLSPGERQRVLAERPAAGRRERFVQRLAELREIPARLRASEYVRVGESRRFRATQRRRTQTASRIGFLVIGALWAATALAVPRVAARFS